MSVASQLEQLETDITNAYSAIDTKGGTIPANKNTNNLATAINSISTGGGGGGSISDYIANNPQEEEYDVKSLLLQLPSTLNMGLRLNLDFYFDSCTRLTTLPSLTNCTNIQTASAMASSCFALVNVPYYYMPNCTSFGGAFSDSELLSDQSIDNIMQMLINCDNENYIDVKALDNVIPNSICYKAEGLAHYQDFLDAGWVLNESDLEQGE